jgi:hypothetical protein
MGWTSLSGTRQAELILAIGFPLLAVLGYFASLMFQK